MCWQDLLFASGALVFIFSLIPMIRDSNKPSVWASGPTFIVLYLYSFAEFTLGLYFATCTTTITATMWLTLFIQKWRQDGKRNS